jgi:hypothetical protein
MDSASIFGPESKSCRQYRRLEPAAAFSSYHWTPTCCCHWHHMIMIISHGKPAILIGPPRRCKHRPLAEEKVYVRSSQHQPTPDPFPKQYTKQDSKRIVHKKSKVGLPNLYSAFAPKLALYTGLVTCFRPASITERRGLARGAQYADRCIALSTD